LMGFNTIHMDQMIEENILTNVIAHEIGHVLGLGTMWQDQIPDDQYVDGPWNQYGAGDLVENQFEYVGPNALEAYSEFTGRDETFVPLENGSSAPGDGSVGSHWSESDLGSELMTPIADGDLHFSEITKGALSDLGYETTGITSLEVKLTSLQEADTYLKNQNLSSVGCSCNTCCGLLGISDLTSYIEHLSETDAISDTSAKKIIDHLDNKSIAQTPADNEKDSITPKQQVVNNDLHPLEGPILTTATSSNIHNDDPVVDSIDGTTADDVVIGSGEPPILSRSLSDVAILSTHEGEA